MLSKVLSHISKSRCANISTIVKREGRSIWRSQGIQKMELPSLENVCKRAFGTGVEGKMEVSRNITGFQPCLNDFIVQYNLASDKTTILQKLVRNSEKCGFSVLSKAVNDYLLESNPTNQLNVYSMLVISAIQVKDDTLLSYILDDISHFLPVNNNVIYEVLKRVCHYRKYPQLIQFLDEYMNVSHLLRYYVDPPRSF